MPSRRSALLRRYAPKRRIKRRGMKNPVEDALINAAAVVVIIIIVISIKNIFFSETKIKSSNVSAQSVSAFAISNKTLVALRDLSTKYNLDFPELVSVYSLHNDFYPSKSVGQTKEEIEQSFILNYGKIKQSYKPKVIEPYIDMFTNLLNEIKYFPIMHNYSLETESGYIFSDSWGSARNYEGDKSHQGCDILDRENVRGSIPIASMTDGFVEHVGWSELGGFRVGIRSASGNYYYYAHMDSFAQGLTKDTVVKAGQHIGFMGDTGYSKKEGTAGNFPVHLHVGISPATDLVREQFWINPYPFLRLIEDNRIDY